MLAHPQAAVGWQVGSEFWEAPGDGPSNPVLCGRSGRREYSMDLRAQKASSLQAPSLGQADYFLAKLLNAVCASQTFAIFENYNSGIVTSHQFVGLGQTA